MFLVVGLKNKKELIFDNWQEGEFDDSLPYIFGQDYGFDDPTTLVKVAINKKKKLLYLDECFYLSGLDETKIFEMNHKICEQNLIVGDSASKQLINSLRNKKGPDGKGINLIGAVKKAGSVLSGIIKLQQYTLIISERSVNLKTELNNYVWLDRKSDTPVDDFNHLIDPIRYALGYLDR